MSCEEFENYTTLTEVWSDLHELVAPCAYPSLTDFTSIFSQGLDSLSIKTGTTRLPARVQKLYEMLFWVKSIITDTVYQFHERNVSDFCISIIVGVQLIQVWKSLDGRYLLSTP
jgi:hypothetical protein